MSAWPPPVRAMLPDGRLHLQDGPIDLVIGIEGVRPAVMLADGRFNASACAARNSADSASARAAR